MSEPDEAMVEAVAMAIRDDRGALDVDADGIPDSQWRTLARAALSVPAVRDALARDAQVGGIVASNGDPFESLRAIAAMYPVPATADELVPARCRCGDEAWDPHQHCRKSAHGNTCCHCGCTAYPSPSDRDDSEEQR